MIASTFFFAWIIESWGRGIEKITLACGKAHTPPPRFQTELGGLMLTFPEPAWLKDVAPEVSSTEMEQLSGNKTTQETTQEKIIAMIRKTPSVTRFELAQQIGLSPDGIKYHLKRLRDNGKIHHVGPTKAGYWEILYE